MKKWLGLILSLILLLASVAAIADTAVQSTLTRNIKINNRNADGSFPSNPVIPGESTTTGLPTGNTSYVPILIQIDNNLGAYPQWGISAADIMYELPIAGMGLTRLTAFFSDNYPSEAGPVRSGRVMHADLREEWDALLLHYGKQEDRGSDMREALREYGAAKKGLAADGIANMYKDYFARTKYHPAPHNVTVYVEKFRDLMISNGYQFPLRPFKFTDDRNYGGIPATKFNVIHKGNKDTSSSFVYDESRNAYLRFTTEGAYFDLLKPEISLAYNNVIIQRTKLSWNNSSVAPLFNEIVGTGACDMFVGGQYVAGVWARNKLNERTVFFDQNGNEIALQRGKTWIIICDDATQILFGDLDKSQAASLFIAGPVSESDPSLAKLFTATTTNTTKPTNKPIAPTPQPVSSTPEVGAVQQDTAIQQPEGSTSDINSNSSTAVVRVANNGFLNMRKEASKGSELVSRIKSGSVVEVLSIENDWTNIRYEGKVGYVMTEYLEFIQVQPVSGQEDVVTETSAYPTLKLGDQGKDVLKLKKRLFNLGYFRTSNLNDRYIDSTVEAVSMFEKRNSLPIDGVADAQMQTVLYSKSAKKQ